MPFCGLAALHVADLDWRPFEPSLVVGYICLGVASSVPAPSGAAAGCSFRRCLQPIVWPCMPYQDGRYRLDPAGSFFYDGVQQLPASDQGKCARAGMDGH